MPRKTRRGTVVIEAMLTDSQFSMHVCHQGVPPSLVIIPNQNEMQRFEYKVEEDNFTGERQFSDLSVIDNNPGYHLTPKLADS